MKLGDYTFTWTPDRFTVPAQDKFYSAVRTYSSMHYFSWGLDIIGKVIKLNWNWMYEKEFLNLQKLLEDDEQKTWYPQAPMQLYHDTVVGGPFAVGENLCGAGGAVGTISAVNIVHNYVTFSVVNGTFYHDEFIQVTAPAPKTSTCQGVRIIPNYTVEVLSIKPEYFESLTTNFIYVENVELQLMIIAEA